MNSTTERAFCKAMTKTLRAYERLIERPKEKVEKWSNYGLWIYCGACLSLNNVCGICPLAPCTMGDGSETFVNLHREIHRLPLSYGILKQAARARYRWLIKKIGESGYEYR